jgi:hypothetical protein
MATLIGAFLVEDGFFITGRGLVLAGVLSGQVEAGNQLAFPSGAHWRVKGVNCINAKGRLDVVGLLVDTPISSREELLTHSIIGATAEIFTG